MKIRYLTIPLLLVLVGAGIATTVVPALASAASPTSLNVQTNSPVDSLASANIQVQVQGGTPSSSYAVTVQVAAPTGAGGPFCQTMNISTNSNGNGQETVAFPGTFLASGCAPAGTGGPSTILAGKYTVTVSSVPAITAGTMTTTFSVQAPLNVVSGTGTTSAQLTTSTAFIPAPGSTTASPLFASCTGTTTSPTTTNAPYYATQVGSSAITGLISSNSPGQIQANALRNPCSPTTAATYVSTNDIFYTYSSVTITLPDGKTVTGGLQITIEATTSTITSSGTTSSTLQDHLTLTGTGGLRGLTGIGVATGSVVQTGSVATVSTVYWVQLTLGYYY